MERKEIERAQRQVDPSSSSSSGCEAGNAPEQSRQVFGIRSFSVTDKL